MITEVVERRCADPQLHPAGSGAPASRGRRTKHEAAFGAARRSNVALTNYNLPNDALTLTFAVEPRTTQTVDVSTWL